MNAAQHGWANLVHGTAVEKTCDYCGRVLFVKPTSTDLLCDGCGDPAGDCVCPDIRELA